MTVWAVHHSNKDGVDTSAALAYGEIRAVNMRYVYPDELNEDGSLPKAFTDKMRLCARLFNSAEDFLLLQGDDVQLAAFTAELIVHHGWFRALRWDRIEKAYVRVRISPTGRKIPLDRGPAIWSDPNY